MTQLLNSISRRISSVSAVLASLTTFALALSITTDVIIRLTTGSSLPGLVELSETLLVALVFLGVSYTAYIGGHVAMSLVTDRLPARWKGWVRALANLLVVGVLVWLIYATGERAIQSYASGEYKFGLTQFPLWPARWAIVIGLVVTVPVALLRLSVAIRDALERPALPGVPSLDRGGTGAS